MLLPTWESQGSLTKEVIAKRFRRIKRKLPNSGEGGGHGKALAVVRQHEQAYQYGQKRRVGEVEARDGQRR